MSVAKVIELTSASAKSIEDAIEQGVRRADQTLDQVEGIWVQDIKATVKNGKIAEWRVNYEGDLPVEELIVNRCRRAGSSKALRGPRSSSPEMRVWQGPRSYSHGFRSKRLYHRCRNGSQPVRTSHPHC